ncbi:MAG TPA: hypothetical protein VK250_12540 [Nitrososphaeraceae archaeon]|nr:hypothetical protein [Nitrososphaeraceae archaeon]
MSLVNPYILNQLLLVIIILSVFFDLHISSSQEYKINDLLSLDVQILKNPINLGEEQIIQFLLNDTTLNNKINQTALIEGNIIYLSGIAQPFSLNITPSKWYKYSWTINPDIQKFGTVLVEINLLYNESKINMQNITFNISKEKNINNS